MTELTELMVQPAGGRRLWHALAYQAPLRFAGRVVEVGAEIAWARARDVAEQTGRAGLRVTRQETGHAVAVSAGRRVALYAHYAASGAISPMVRAQLALYRAQGFDVVFATNAAEVPSADWAGAAQHCCLMVQRCNVGFDFGAWQDAAAVYCAGRPPPDELLLVNDSVLGPIHPIAPLVAYARASGAGAVGLTESQQGGVHLQSYFVLVLGQPATAATLQFLGRLRLSTGKWLMVQRGEFGLTRHLLRRRHRVSALFGYDRALEAILACPDERRYLAGLLPERVRGSEAPERLGAIFRRWPLNPTHHLWRGLPRCQGFPFLKTALISRNPGRLAGVEDWPGLVGGDTELLRRHLAGL